MMSKVIPWESVDIDKLPSNETIKEEVEEEQALHWAKIFMGDLSHILSKGEGVGVISVSYQDLEHLNKIVEMAEMRALTK